MNPANDNAPAIVANSGAPRAYYNEIDPFAAAWLRNLIRDGHIAPGDVDERSIVDVRPADLAGYTQCHFFAGIGVWSGALRASGWPDTRRIWTASCPCQLFSAAGKGGGFDDERHLWPALQWLIQQCRPNVVFGEQVASKDRTWRWRRYWRVGRRRFVNDTTGSTHCYGKMKPGRIARNIPEATGSSQLGVAQGDANDSRLEVGSLSTDGGRVVRVKGATVGAADAVRGFWSRADWIYCRDGKYRPVEPGSFPLAHGLARGMGTLGAELRRLAEMAGLDGRSLARAKAHRIGSLKGYGNAIVRQHAQAFIESYCEAIAATTAANDNTNKDASLAA